MKLDLKYISGRPLLIINDLFSKKVNKDIFEEALSLKGEYKPAKINEGINKKFRNNITVIYDNIYIGRRNESSLLNNMDSLFTKNVEFRSILSSSPYPLNQFGFTNTHETQVSRYGGGQKYEFHSDVFNKNSRKISAVYYFGLDKFEGGEIEFISSPVFDGKAYLKTYDSIKIKPKNNMMVLFDSFLPHRVHKTTSPKEFKLGRFSVNLWVGNR